MKKIILFIFTLLLVTGCTNNIESKQIAKKPEEIVQQFENVAKKGLTIKQLSVTSQEKSSEISFELHNETNESIHVEFLKLYFYNGEEEILVPVYLTEHVASNSSKPLSITTKEDLSKADRMDFDIRRGE